MELGPIQKKWVADLREHPERQISSSLGYLDNNGEPHLCCMGQALITMKEFEGANIEELFVFNEYTDTPDLYDGLSTSDLPESWKQLGLHDLDGGFHKGDGSYNSLIDMNDNGVTWPEIADFIEANPTTVFKEPK